MNHYKLVRYVSIRFYSKIICLAITLLNGIVLVTQPTFLFKTEGHHDIQESSNIPNSSHLLENRVTIGILIDMI